MAFNYLLNVETVGFCAGFVWCINKPKDIVEYPISTFFWGSISGSIVGSFCSHITEENPRVRPLLAGMLLASSGYHLYKLSKKERRSS